MNRSVTRLATLTVVLTLSLLGGAGKGAHAGEIDERKQITERFTRLFAAGDYAALDAWYDKALQQDTRTAGGHRLANRLVRSIAFGPGPGQSPADEPYWQAQQHQATRWLAARPQSILATIALSKVYAYQAWSLRDSDAGKSLELNLQGQKLLLAQSERGRKDPNWWAVLLTQAHNTRMPAKEQRQLAQDAIAAFPQHPDIYTRIATTRVPQEGGSHKALADLAGQAVENTKPHEGQSLYALLYWSVQDQLAPNGQAAFTHRQVDWPRIRAGFDDLVQRHPDPYNINTYARLACVAAKDKKATAEVLQRMGNNIVQQAWSSREEFMGCQAWAGGAAAR